VRPCRAVWSRHCGGQSLPIAALWVDYMALITALILAVAHLPGFVALPTSSGL
jgi:hypothetical protein